MLGPSNKLLNSFGLEADGFERTLSESRPKGGRLSRLIMERSEPDSGRRQKDSGLTSNLKLTSASFTVLDTFNTFISDVPLVSSLAFCVAKSANQCSAELLPSPDGRESLVGD